MASKSQIRRMTKSELKSWLTDQNQRLPNDERTKDYYLNRALTTFKTLHSSDEEGEESDSENGRQGRNSDAENTPLKQAIRRRRTSIQDGYSSGASVGSKKKQAISRRSRRTSTNSMNSANSVNKVPSVTKKGKRIVKTRRKTPVRYNSSNRSNKSNGSIKSNNSSNASSKQSKSKKKVVTRRKTQRKGSPTPLTNSIKRKRNRMRRATDDPVALREASNDVNDSNVSEDESESDEMENNNVKYWIEFEPSQQTIQQLKQWLTSKNIEIPQTTMRKAHFVNLVLKHSKSIKDDSSLYANRNNNNNNINNNINNNSFNNGFNNVRKRGLSPKHKKTYISPAKRTKRVVNNRNIGETDSPPLPPNLDPSPLTPPDSLQLNKNRKKSPTAAKNSIANNNMKKSNNFKDAVKRKKGMLVTPALLKTKKVGISDSARASMRNEIQQVLASDSDTEMAEYNNNNTMNNSKDFISTADIDSILDNDKDDESDESSDSNDENAIAEQTRYNTMMNQRLSSKQYNDELERIKKKQQKQRKQQPKQRLGSKLSGNNHVAAAAVPRGGISNNLASPFGFFGSIMNRVSPFRTNKTIPHISSSNNNNSNNNNNDKNDKNAQYGVSSVKNRLNYDKFDKFDKFDNGDNVESDDDPAMSPYSQDTHQTGNKINNRNNDNKTSELRRGRNVNKVNLIEEEMLRSDEENIPTDPDSPSLNYYNNNNRNKNRNNRNRKVNKPYYGGNQSKQPSMGGTAHNIRDLTNNIKNINNNNKIRKNIKKVKPKPMTLNNNVNSNNIKQHPSNMAPNIGNAAQYSPQQQQRRKRSKTSKFVSFCVAILGIVVSILLSGIFIDSLRQNSDILSNFNIDFDAIFGSFSNSFSFDNLGNLLPFEREYSWFCDSGKFSVNGHKFNSKGEPCYPCPSDNTLKCENGRAFCSEHHRLSGKKCVLDSKAVQMAHEIELTASQILSVYQGRADCGEDIDPGLLENQLKVQLKQKLRRKDDEFEDGWKYFITNVLSDSIIRYNSENKRFYGTKSSKSLICQLKLFLLENIIQCIFIIILFSMVAYWIHKYYENRKIYDISKKMREYTFEILKEQKLKNPSYKAVSQLKQDNMKQFKHLIGSGKKRKQKIWDIVKDKFERDAYIQCSQRTVDGIQKLCWQVSDTYIKPNLSFSSNSGSNVNDISNVNSLNNGLNTNLMTNMNNFNNGNQIPPSANNRNNNMFANISNSIKKPLRFIENTPLFGRKTRNMRDNMNGMNGMGGVNGNINNNMNDGPQSPSNVYGVPINQPQRHSVISPSRSFGVTPVIPRNKRMSHLDNRVDNRMDQQRPSVPFYSKYNPWG